MTPQVALVPARAEHRHIIANLYPLFIHDQWAYSETLPNRHGIIGSATRADGATPRTLAEQAEMIAPYWSRATHSPFLIQADGKPAGFVLLQSRPAAPDGLDFYLDELFVLHPFRRTGVASSAVRSLWRDRPGRWALEVKVRAAPALQFWRGLIPQETGTIATEASTDGVGGPFVQMIFEIC